MTPLVLFVAAASSVIASAVTMLVVRMVNAGRSEMAFIVGAVVGTCAGAIAHQRGRSTPPSVVEKLSLGAVLALTALVFGCGAQAIAAPYEFPEISIGFAVVGSFFFPLVMPSAIWKSSKDQKA